MSSHSTSWAPVRGVASNYYEAGLHTVPMQSFPSNSTTNRGATSGQAGYYSQDYSAPAQSYPSNSWTSAGGLSSGHASYYQHTDPAWSAPPTSRTLAVGSASAQASHYHQVPTQSATSSSWTSTGGAAPSQAGFYNIPMQATQPSASTHRNIAHDDELDRLQRQNQALMHAYVNGQVSGAEFVEAQARIADASRAYGKRLADFDARSRAGMAGAVDFCKEFCGCTDGEAEAHLRERFRLLEMESEARMAQKRRGY